MTIKIRQYKDPEDFKLIGDFLVKTYKPGGKYPNWLRPRWEYMYYHPYTEIESLNNIGIWEDNGEIVAVVNHEGDLGEAYFEVHPDYTHLKASMLEYAEEHFLRDSDNGKKYLKAYINDFDNELIAIAQAKRYVKEDHNPDSTGISQFTITDSFPRIELPDGFILKSLEDDNNLRKVNQVLWRGFNHDGEAPEDGIEDRKRMQSAPNFRKDLTIVVEAPNGDFVSFCGMWYDSVNKIAYVEPVAADPDYRGMGLGKAAVLEGIRRCKELGATVAYVESGKKFYEAIGFEIIFRRYPWIKYFD